MWWKPGRHVAPRRRVPSAGTASMSSGCAAKRAALCCTWFVRWSRTTGVPPMKRHSMPSGRTNSAELPIQLMRTPSAQAIAIMYTKSRFDVCGAAISTKRRGTGTVP